MIDRYECADRAAVGFSMDYPHGLASGMHRHRKAQLVYAISGMMHVETAEASFLLPPTKALFLPADVEHSIRMEGDVAMREVFMNRNLGEAIALAPRVLTVSPLLRELVLAICQESIDWPVDGRSPHLIALIIDEIRRAKTLMTRLPQLRDPRLALMARTIMDDPADARTLEDWAEVCGASARTLGRLFVQDTGMTFGHWRLQARLNVGFILLMTDGEIARIARRVGFASQSAFGAAFRRTFGMTPAQARTLHLDPA
ncbi:AraC family transcriptional regulator [Agrobacterium fabrum]|uniref:AraC family transcriptional regulator n=1 Tax=Agrobacterium fabrum TaxID=1176649 RepID=UPI001572806D|nr:helix-turn-helix transcriptional regulator [Agrobacterium fabrum]WCK80156.1 helix-turn-helix transcriptional regulator [Agrobacterium fabrum]